jgi:hypothetical protein
MLAWAGLPKKKVKVLDNAGESDIICDNVINDSIQVKLL